MKFEFLKIRKTILPVLILGVFMSSNALDNGLALTPPMGWNPWSEFKWNINEATFKEIAQAMIDKGLQNAGYIYMNQDGGGNYNNNSLGDWVHDKGFKFGVYGNNVNYSTPESEWVSRWISYGADYVKWDAYNSSWNDQTYIVMRDALAASGREIVYSAHWGDHSVSATTCDMANLWRTTPDIYIPWEAPADAWNKIVNYIHMNNAHAQYAKPGAWNDPDFLLVGLTDGWTDPNVVGFTYDENKTHFSLWCISAAPLLIGADVRDLKDENVAILTNSEAIAINQDSLGYQGRIVKDFGDQTEIWSKILQNGDRAVLLVNFSSSPKSITVAWSDIGMTGTVSVRDIWTPADMGSIADNMTMSDIPPHGCAMFRISGQASGINYNLSANAHERMRGARHSIRMPFGGMQGSIESAHLFDARGRLVSGDRVQALESPIIRLIRN